MTKSLFIFVLISLISINLPAQSKSDSLAIRHFRNYVDSAVQSLLSSDDFIYDKSTIPYFQAKDTPEVHIDSLVYFELGRFHYNAELPYSGTLYKTNLQGDTSLEYIAEFFNGGYYTYIIIFDITNSTVRTIKSFEFSCKYRDVIMTFNSLIDSNYADILIASEDYLSYWPQNSFKVFHLHQDSVMSVFKGILLDSVLTDSIHCEYKIMQLGKGSPKEIVQKTILNGKQNFTIYKWNGRLNEFRETDFIYYLHYWL